MSEAAWRELLVLLGAVAASAFGLLRMGLTQHRAVTDRFLESLERSLQHQQATADKLHESLGALAEQVRDTGSVLRRVAEQLKVNFSVEEDDGARRLG